MLNDEFEFYLKNQKKLLKEYEGKFLVIKGKKVEGALDSFDNALKWALDKYEIGTFLIQECTPGEDNYTQTFHSRAVFV